MHIVFEFAVEIPVQKAFEIVFDFLLQNTIENVVDFAVESSFERAFEIVVDFVFESSGFKDIKISNNVDFQKLYNLKKVQ